MPSRIRAASGAMARRLAHPARIVKVVDTGQLYSVTQSLQPLRQSSRELCLARAVRPCHAKPPCTSGDHFAPHLMQATRHPYRPRSAIHAPPAVRNSPLTTSIALMRDRDIQLPARPAASA